MRYLLILCLLSISCANSQKNQTKALKVGGPCEGCEAIYEYGDRQLLTIDTLPGFDKVIQKIKIAGTIYKKDGKTPAKDVILYAYQTDANGIYPKKTDSKGWERRHGYIRGWIKTDKTGTYTFYTLRPGSYPNTTIPQHIHFTVKEPDKNEYYIDDIYFDDDPNLTQRIRNRTNFRAGSGIVKLRKENGLLAARRDIILGLNIPDYP